MATNGNGKPDLIPFLKVCIALTLHRPSGPGRFGFLTEPGITER